MAIETRTVEELMSSLKKNWESAALTLADEGAHITEIRRVALNSMNTHVFTRLLEEDEHFRDTIEKVYLAAEAFFHRHGRENLYKSEKILRERGEFNSAVFTLMARNRIGFDKKLSIDDRVGEIAEQKISDSDILKKYNLEVRDD